MSILCWLIPKHDALVAHIMTVAVAHISFDLLARPASLCEPRKTSDQLSHGIVPNPLPAVFSPLSALHALSKQAVIGEIFCSYENIIEVGMLTDDEWKSVEVVTEFLRVPRQVMETLAASNKTSLDLVPMAMGHQIDHCDSQRDALLAVNEDLDTNPMKAKLSALLAMIRAVLDSGTRLIATSELASSGRIPLSMSCHGGPPGKICCQRIISWRRTTWERQRPRRSLSASTARQVASLRIPASHCRRPSSSPQCASGRGLPPVS